MKDYLLLTGKMVATADERMNNETVKKLWNSFNLTTGDISFEKGETYTFQLGNTPLPTLSAGKEYALKVDKHGAAIVGKDYSGLMRGFFSLIMKIEHEREMPIIKAVTEESEYTINNRMIHICVFPENDLYFIKKLIRLCALCQYTHIVIEFWGMLKYDCLKELAWPHAFTKEQAKELICECRELGIEPIPMFNMFGHASASRVCYGKHVVLDQNPTLQRYFTPDGWAWDITNPTVYDLFKKVRQELYAVFGPTQHFHIGFDEAYFYMHREDLRKRVPAFLSRLTADIVAEGRRPMLWMDMILKETDYPSEYYAYGKEDEAEQLLGALSKETVMVDWQYKVVQPPVLSSVYLKNKGHDLIVAPWLKKANYTACIDTVTEHNLHGLMLTTWHTLKDDMFGILGCAKKCGAKSFVWSVDRPREETAALLRRVSFEGNTYSDCGWSKEQIEI